MLSSSDDAVILPPSAPKRREPRPPSSRALPRQYLNSGFSRPPIYTYATHQDASAYPIITPEDSASRSLGLYRPTSSRLVVSSPPVLSRPSTASASILRNRRPIDLDWTAAQKIFEFTQKYLNDQERVEEEAIKAEVMERRARQKSVAFIEQSKQPDGESTHQNQQPEKSSEELEHENFMSKVNAILVNESIKSLPTTASSSLHRPKTAPSTRYKGSDTQSEQSKFVQKKSSSAKEKGDSMTLPRRASTAQQKARPVPKTEPNEEAAKRPFTAPIRSKQKKGSKLSVEEAREVMQFFETSQLFATKRLSDKPKTLADWRIAQRSGDASWNPSDFSVQAFMSGYMKKRAQAEDTLIRRASRMSTFVPVSKKAAAQKLPGIAEATDLPLAQQKRGGIVFTEVAKPVKKKTDRRSAFNMHKYLGKMALDPKELVKKRRMSRMDILTAPKRFTDDHPDIGVILRKPPIDRNSDEKKALFKVMRPLRAFQKFSDFTLSEVVGSLVLLEMESNRAVFKQGDTGTAWYIILSGTVSVQITRSGRIEDSVEVAQLHDGSGFGDLALVNEEPRAATILTEVLCQLVFIEKADFNRTVKFSQEKEIKEKILFLRKVEMLNEFTPPALKSLAQVVEWKRFKPGAIIQQQGSPVKNFYFIRSGECTVLRSMVQILKRKEIHVKIGTLSKYDYFGEEGVSSISLDGGVSTYVSDAAIATIMASKDGGEVEVGVMTCYDAKVKISLIAQNPLHSKSDGEVARIHQEMIARRAWEKQKKRFFDDFAREKNIDPNMTADKWKRVQASAGRRKRAWI